MSTLKRERVREFLLELIETRPPGAPIPAERALCLRLSVSRPTVRSAVADLVLAGLLVREHGRGTFVAPAKITQQLGPAEAPPAPGMWSSRVLRFVTVPAGARVGRRLRLSPAAQVRYVNRLRLADGEPIAVERLYTPAAVTVGLTETDLETGFYAWLRRSGVRLRDAVQTIEPTVTNEIESELLGIPALSPALLFERLTTDATGRQIEYVHSVYRGDRYRIMSRLALDSTAAPYPVPADAHHPGIPPGELAGRDLRYAATVGDLACAPSRRIQHDSPRPSRPLAALSQGPNTTRYEDLAPP